MILNEKKKKLNYIPCVKLAFKYIRIKSFIPLMTKD